MKDKQHDVNEIVAFDASNDPLYRKLVKSITQQIDQGYYKEGAKLPTEKQLCQYYNISRVTVRRALIELENNNLIVSRQGSGIYVTPHLFKQSLQKFYSFSQETRKKGHIPSDKIISFDTISGSSAICEIMGLESRTTLIRIVRLRLSDNIPMIYETSYLQADRLSGLDREILEGHSLYDLMTSRYNIILESAKEIFSACLPSELIASYLQIKEQTPCISLKRITRSLSEVVEYTESIVRGDNFEFIVELKNL